MKFAHIRVSEYFTFAEQIFHSEAISLAQRANFVEKRGYEKILLSFLNKVSNSHGGIVLYDRYYFSSKMKVTQSYSPYETDINISMSVVISNVSSLLKLSIL